MFARDHPEMLAWLPLAHFDDLPPSRRRILRSLVRDPARATIPLRGILSAARAAEIAGAREHFARMVSMGNVLAYWAGVGEATTGVRNFDRLRADPRAVDQAPHELDLDDDRWTPPRAGMASQVRISSGGRTIGFAPVRWGGLPWQNRRFLTAAATNFAAALTGARLGDEAGR